MIFIHSSDEHLRHPLFGTKLGKSGRVRSIVSRRWDEHNGTHPLGAAVDVAAGAGDPQGVHVAPRAPHVALGPATRRQ